MHKLPYVQPELARNHDDTCTWKIGRNTDIKEWKSRKVNTKPEGAKNGGTYAAWHPTGRYIAFSMNEIQQFFHSSGQNPIEVSDLAADLMVYDTQRKRSSRTPDLWG